MYSQLETYFCPTLYLQTVELQRHGTFEVLIFTTVTHDMFVTMCPKHTRSFHTVWAVWKQTEKHFYVWEMPQHAEPP